MTSPNYVIEARHLMFPLTFASTTFLPGESMNPILKVFAENQADHPGRGGGSGFDAG